MMEGNHPIDIQHPEVWELLVSIEDKQVNYILYTPTVAGSLIIGEKAPVDDSLQALEDAIYETPELLADYRRVRVLVHSQRFVLLPDTTADEDCEAMLRHAFPGDDGDASVGILRPDLLYLVLDALRFAAHLHRLFYLVEHSHCRGSSLKIEG